MKYKIKNHIIDAKSPVEALKIHKLLDSVKDSLTKEERELVDYCIDNLEHGNDADKLVRVMSIYRSEYANLARRKPNEIKEYFREVIGDSCKDSQEELDYLTEEEERAVDDYRQAIENTTNPKLLKLYQHILEEELEHIEELTSAEVVEDSHTNEELLAVSKELMKNKIVITQSESIAKEYAKNKNPYHKYKVSKVSNGYKIEVVDACKTKDADKDDVLKAIEHIKNAAIKEDYIAVKSLANNMIRYISEKGLDKYKI